MWIGRGISPVLILFNLCLLQCGMDSVVSLYIYVLQVAGKAQSGECYGNVQQLVSIPRGHEDKLLQSEGVSF